jgi:hypothetical protein
MEGHFYAGINYLSLLFYFVYQNNEKMTDLLKLKI